MVLARNLGILFDTQLSFKAQSAAVVKPCIWIIRLLRKVLTFLPHEVQVIVVMGPILLRLDCVNVLYLGIPDYLLECLQVVPNMAVRLLYKLPKHSCVSFFREKLHWLPVHKRIMFKALTMTHQALHNTGLSTDCSIG